jgi:hypothetical protein
VKTSILPTRVTPGLDGEAIGTIAAVVDAGAGSGAATEAAGLSWGFRLGFFGATGCGSGAAAVVTALISGGFAVVAGASVIAG